MTQSKNTKRALCASVLSVLLCVAMLLGSTWAWFTDTVSSNGNKIVAGNLKADLIHVGGEEGENVSIKENPKHLIFDCDKWEPNYTVMETLKVVNNGNLAFKFRLDAVAAGATAGPNGEKLADVIDVWVYEGEGIPSTTSFAEMTAENGWRNAGSLSKLMADPDGIARGVLLPEKATPKNDEPVGSVQMTVALHMQETAGNEYQGLTLGSLNFTLNATQYTYEDDAFDDQYDANATYGNFKEFEAADGQTMTADEFQAALDNGKWENMAFKSDVAIDKAVNLTSDAVLDFGGNTVNVPSNYLAINSAGAESVTPIDVTIENADFSALSTNGKPRSSIVVQGPTNLTVKNSTFTSTLFTDSNFSNAVVVQAKKAKSVIVFENCTFTNAGIPVQNTTKGDVNVDVIFRNCTFVIERIPNGKAVITVETFDGPTQVNIEIDNCRFDVTSQSNSWCIQGKKSSGTDIPNLNITLRDVTFIGRTNGYTAGTPMIYKNAETTVKEEGTCTYQRVDHNYNQPYYTTYNVDYYGDILKD